MDIGTQFPKLLYVCDFPPANKGGGDTLIYRLLASYPKEQLYLIFSSRRRSVLHNNPFGSCSYSCFVELAGVRRHGFANILLLVDRALLPVWGLLVALRIALWEAKVIVTVAHGYLFLAAAVSSWLTGRPLIVIVHDDWVVTERHIYGFRYFTKPLFRWALSRAKHVFSVSDSMAEYLRSTFGVASEVQWPGTDQQRISVGGVGLLPPESSIKIVFAGMIYGTVHQSLDHLVRYIIKKGGKKVHLHLYSNYNVENCIANGWDHPNIHAQGWVAQEVLQTILNESDILFLPVSFEAQANYYSQTSFPSKVADYLAVGRPILLLAPDDAAITRYARMYGFAEIVTDLSEESLERAVCRLCDRGVHVTSMVEAGQRVFRMHHDMSAQRSRFASLIKASAEET